MDVSLKMRGYRAWRYNYGHPKYIGAVWTSGEDELTVERVQMEAGRGAGFQDWNISVSIWEESEFVVAAKRQSQSNRRERVLGSWSPHEDLGKEEQLHCARCSPRFC